MRASHLHIKTLREAPAEATVASHQLLLRAGMIRMEAAGIYSWLPLGLRVLQRVSQLVREEMNRSGAVEVLLPMTQPAEIWQQSGRWDEYGPELQTFEDRRGRLFCLGPTHEETICCLARDELQSYRDLPVNYYQIQTKYRGEARPRFGLLRAREFLMKDAYSFDADAKSLQHSYDKMRQAYCRIFDRLGLEYRIVAADSGSIGGNASEEFHVLSEDGEDIIACSEGGQYAANLEMAVAADAEQTPTPPAPTQPMQEVKTPGATTIDLVCEMLELPHEKSVKTMIVRGTEQPLVALILRGDHQLNEIKASGQPEIAAPLQMASEAEIVDAFGAHPGSLGPVNCPIAVLADTAAAAAADFCCGANRDGYHFTGVNWSRDAEAQRICDLRNIVDGDPSPCADGALKLWRSIEVGHIFQLGDKYSRAMDVRVLSEEGQEITPLMGCYGIGVSRIVAAAVQQHRDEKGILWPESMSPFDLSIIPLAGADSEVYSAAEQLCDAMTEAGISVLLDDRPLRPGVKLADFELIGTCRALILGERSFGNSQMEYRNRRTGEESNLALDTPLAELLELLRGS